MSLPKQLLKHTLDYATDIMDTLIDTIDKPPLPDMEFGNLKVFLQRNKCGLFKSIKFVLGTKEFNISIPKEGMKFEIINQSGKALIRPSPLTTPTPKPDFRKPLNCSKDFFTKQSGAKIPAEITIGVVGGTTYVTNETDYDDDYDDVDVE
jgi:hypothetical protein